MPPTPDGKAGGLVRIGVNVDGFPGGLPARLRADGDGGAIPTAGLITDAPGLWRLEVTCRPEEALPFAGWIAQVAAEQAGREADLTPPAHLVALGQTKPVRKGYLWTAAGKAEHERHLAARDAQRTARRRARKAKALPLGGTGPSQAPPPISGAGKQ